MIPIPEWAEDALVFDQLDEAILYFGMQFNRPIAIYDREKCIDIFAGGMDNTEDAEEYFEFNVAGAWIGEGTPVFISTRYDDE